MSNQDHNSEQRRRLVEQVTVTSVKKKTYSITVGNYDDEDAVLVDEEVVGYRPLRRNLFEPQPEYPDEIESIEVTLSNGKKYAHYSDILHIEKRHFATVTKIRRETHKVTIDDSPSGMKRVLVDGKPVGYKIRGRALPDTFDTITVKIRGEGGKSVTLASHPIPVKKRPEHIVLRDDGWYNRRTRQKCDFWTELREEPGMETEIEGSWYSDLRAITYKNLQGYRVGMKLFQRRTRTVWYPDVEGMTNVSFDDLSKYKVGDVTFERWEYAFWRREDGFVTNGDITWPGKRPHGTYEWNRCPRYRYGTAAVQSGRRDPERYPRFPSFASVFKSETAWQTFLSALIGCYLDEVNTDAGIRERVQVFKEEQKKRKYDIVVKCFDAKQFDTDEDVEISIGGRLLFKGQKYGCTFFIVDNASDENGALYLFSEEQEQIARDFANRRIPWRTVRFEEGNCVTSVNHDPNDTWVARLDEAMRVYAEQQQAA